MVADERTVDLYPHPATPVTLFAAGNPRAIVAQATELAAALKDVVTSRKLYLRIGTRDHIYVEGWTLLGSMLGVFPVCAWSRPLADAAGWEARGEARTDSGALGGARG